MSCRACAVCRGCVVLCLGPARLSVLYVDKALAVCLLGFDIVFVPYFVVPVFWVVG